MDNSKRTFSTSSLDTEIGNGKQNLSLTPPLQKIIFEKYHRSSRSMSQLKAIKSSLGSSLDQGLDKPVQSSTLGSQSKRICKSEECAIDNKALISAKDKSSNSSNETLNSAILNDIDNITIKDDDIESNDKTVIESNIEIMIPTSISKSRNVDSLESSVSARDRSSNSISSCEMALSGSQNDVDECSNDNHIIKKDGIDDNVFVIDEDLRNVKDAINNVLNNGKYDMEHNSSNNTSQNCDMNDTYMNEQYSNLRKKSSSIETATYSREYFAKSCLSLDDVPNITEKSEEKQRTKSMCSYPIQNAKDTTLQKEYSSALT